MRTFCLAATLLMPTPGALSVGAPSATPRTTRVASVEQDGDTEDRKTLLQRDRAYASRIQEALHSKEFTAQAVREKLGLRGFGTPEEVGLGFGAKLLLASATAGTGSCLARMVVVVEDSSARVVSAQLSFGPGWVGDDWARLQSEFKAELRTSLSPPFDENEFGFIFTWRDEARWSALVGWMREALEAPPPVSMSGLPQNLAQAVQLLGSPYIADRSTFGVTCGIVSTKLPERQAIEDIVAAGRWDLVRELLRGLNPAGRVYAAQALTESGRATPTDVRAIRILRSLEVPVLFCDGGCVVHSSTLEKLLPGPRARLHR